MHKEDKASEYYTGSIFGRLLRETHDFKQEKKYPVCIL